MKQISLTDIRQMSMTESPTPVIKEPKDVLLRIDVVGVCGSDIHYYTTGRIGSQVVEFPFPVGHECSATVQEVGEAVTKFKPGDRVAVDPAICCFTCDQCRAGRHHTCRNLVFMGCPGQIDGCLGEYYVMPEASLFKIPDSMTMDEAALVEPLTIGYYAVKLANMPMKGLNVGILGAGPIGLSVMVAALYKGAGQIFFSEPIDYRREVAINNGATLAVNPFEEGIAPIVKHQPDLLDIVFECSGTQEAVDNALDLLKPGGKLMMIGIPEFDDFRFSADRMRRKEVCIQNVRRQNDCVQETIDMMASGVKTDFLITHRFPFEQTSEAFDLVAAYDDKVVKAMVHLT